MFQEGAGAFFGELRDGLTSSLDRFFLSAANIFVLVCVALVVTPLGGVRLGGDDARPDYGYLGWFAMLFAAGMGIGLMFFGVSEPMSHYGSSLGGTVLENGVRTDWAPLGAAAGDAVAARDLGMAATLFHWALHPWAIYAVVALSLAFFTFNRGLPLTLRSAFYPLLGERVWGWPGHVIDILAVFATLFGLATSLGFGTEQALAGLNYLFGWGTGSVAKVVMIAAITGLALISVLRGLDGGVKVLSEINIALALLLMVFVLAVGPTAEIFSSIVGGAAAYAKQVVPLSMPFGREDANFSQGWTAFYRAWGISWSPFVGMFIARVSRGRTVREFVLCVIPTAAQRVFWCVFEGLVAATLLLVGGSEALSALQAMAVSMGFPFTVVLLVMCVGLLLGLNRARKRKSGHSVPVARDVRPV